jgi:hypothetical protein
MTIQLTSALRSGALTWEKAIEWGLIDKDGVLLDD